MGPMLRLLPIMAVAVFVRPSAGALPPPVYPNPIATGNVNDPLCGGLNQPACSPCGKDYELPCGYAPARSGNILDGNEHTNPYKMFWAPYTTEKDVCEFGGDVAPMTWVSPSGNPAMQYMLINGDVNVNVQNYRRDWWMAQAFCESQSATLVNIKSKTENDFVWCMQPELENRWLGMRLTWVQSPDVFEKLSARRLANKQCAIVNGRRICSLSPDKYLNGETRSAVLRKGRRTAGSQLSAGNYSDGTDFLTFDPLSGVFPNDPPVFGNTLFPDPYSNDGTYETPAPWFPQEPNNRRGMEQCVEMGKAWSRIRPRGNWNDFRCGAEKAFVCARATVSSSTTSVSSSTTSVSSSTTSVSSSTTSTTTTTAPG